MTSEGADSLGGVRVLVAPEGGPPGPEESLDVSTLRIPGYDLGATLAAGRRGPVYRAVRQTDGLAVTVHLIEATLDRGQRRRFRAETAGLLRLPPSPHLMRLLDAGVTASGQPYLVTPRASGTMADRLAPGGIDAMEVARTGRDAAAGLRVLHDAGMLHGNLAPGNLVEVEDGAVAVTGFALPVLEELDGGRPGPYSPPEILEGGDWTASADFYALAATLFALLTGAPPYGRPDAADRLARMRGGAVPEIRDEGVPQRLRVMLRRGLDPNPQARFSTASEVIEQLDRVLRPAVSDSRVETVPPAPAQAPAGRQFGSRYLVGEQIGEGSMGVVCRAVDTDDGQPVAIKLLKPAFTADDGAVTRFLREGSALRRVAHPHLVGVRDFVAESGNFGLVMDLVEGEDLRTVMAAEPLTPAQACTILGQVAGALGAVHAGGIVHRDIKPENVLVERDGEQLTARLADFGIARFAEGPTLTQPGMILWTLAYAAPEMRRGEPASVKSDMYALGVVAYELFAGRRPGQDNGLPTPDAMLTQPAGMPVELWHLVRECLDDEPTRRPDASSLAPTLLALAGALGGQPPLPRWGEGKRQRPNGRASWRDRPITPKPQPIRPVTRVPTAASEHPLPAAPAPDDAPQPRRRTLLVAAAVVIVLGAVAGATAAVLGNARQDPGGADTAAEAAYRQVRVAATASSPERGTVQLTFPAQVPSAQDAELVGYLIYRLGPDGRPAGGGDGELLKTGPLPGPSYEITGAEAGVRHCFRVTALVLGGRGSPASAQQSTPAAACARADGRFASREARGGASAKPRPGKH